MKTEKEKLLKLIIDAKKRVDPETKPFSEFLAEYLADHGVVFPEWTDVDEEKPDPGFVLCRIKSDLFHTKPFVDFLVYEDDQFRTMGYAPRIVDNVIHWMPIYGMEDY